MKKLLLILLLSQTLSSCDDAPYDEGYKARNFLRDRHPYAVIEQRRAWGYDRVFLVGDTLRRETWIYIIDSDDFQGYRVDLFIEKHTPPSAQIFY